MDFIKKLLEMLFGDKEEAAKPAPAPVPAAAPTAARPAAPARPAPAAAPVEEEIEEEEEEEEADDVYAGPVELDPTTKHGKHYTVEAFDAEVEKRVQAWVASEKEDGCNPDNSDISNARFNLAKDLYQAWTRADFDQLITWQNANMQKYTGMAGFGHTQASPDNALLEPIHGISLEDYAGMVVKLGAGADINAICKAMGIEAAVWEEVNTLWGKRMQEDGTYQLVSLYGQYFATAGNNPKLSQVSGAPVSATGQANLDKIKTDRYFYEELCGARQAAYECGMDGAQWIMDNYGISLTDFQAVASQYSLERSKDWSTEEILHFQNHQEAKQKEYAAKFAAATGGNVADDIKF